MDDPRQNPQAKKMHKTQDSGTNRTDRAESNMAPRAVVAAMAMVAGFPAPVASVSHDLLFSHAIFRFSLLFCL